MYDYFGIRLI